MSGRCHRLAFAVTTALLASSAVATEAHADRFALVIGNNEGNARDARLRYAESDAERVARLLVTVGGFEARQTVLLRGRTAGEIRHSLAMLADRLAKRTGDDLVLFYFSGHADAESLHIGTETNGIVLRFDGSRWSRVATPTRDAIHGLAARRTASSPSARPD